MEHVVTNGDERWRAWVKENGWDPCRACDLQGYHIEGGVYQECRSCAGFGFMIPDMPEGSWHFGDKEG